MSLFDHFTSCTVMREWETLSSIELLSYLPDSYYQRTIDYVLSQKTYDSLAGFIDSQAYNVKFSSVGTQSITPRNIPRRKQALPYPLPIRQAREFLLYRSIESQEVIGELREIFVRGDLCIWRVSS